MMTDEHTALYGVVGLPLRHSLSPAMHNAAFRKCGLNAMYLFFESTNLGETMRAVRSVGIKGLSVTTPYKSAVIPFLDRLDPLAERIGAVNTVIQRDGVLTGYNTDGPGALKALKEVLDPRGKCSVILGAGGAARAIGFALKEQKNRLVVANRSREAGERLARDLDASFVSMEDLKSAEADILINATPAGMYPETDQWPLDPAKVRAGVVMDVIYNPLDTKLIERARICGRKVIPGIRMFLFQGAEQFRLWTGQDAPLDVMTAVVQRALKRQPLGRKP